MDNEKLTTKRYLELMGEFEQHRRQTDLSYDRKIKIEQILLDLTLYDELDPMEKFFRDYDRLVIGTTEDPI